MDTGGVSPTIDVIVNGEVVPGFVTDETIVRLEHAYDFLNGDPSGYDEDE